MRIHRTWAMPNKNTFDVKPIGTFVQRYLAKSKVSIDPFARDKRWATYTNDLNPNTKAEYHMDSVDFLTMLEGEGVCPDLMILDPPYSAHQMKTAYGGFGRDMGPREAQRTAGWKCEKDIATRLLVVGGIVLCFGWDSNGMGAKRRFRPIELMIVCHGAGHNDTLCFAERKLAHQERIFEEPRHG